MAAALLDKPRLVRRHKEDCNIGDLLERLGDIPPERVKTWPPPGTATLKDLIAYNDGDRRGPVCELVEGTLVEKAMGFDESVAAGWLTTYINSWNDLINLGTTAVPDGNVRLQSVLSRAPDTAFYCWGQFPDRKKPAGSVPAMFPDLAVEILSKSNTKKEMARKRREYFAAGTRIVWEVDLKKQIVVVYHDPDRGETLDIDGVLDGEDVMPGFQLSIRKWFERVNRSGQ